jgi:hypothetical protein
MFYLSEIFFCNQRKERGKEDSLIKEKGEDILNLAS